MKTAVLMMAHGSRISEENDAARDVAKMVRELTGFDIVEVAFREMHGALREMLNFIRTGKKPRTECHDNIKSLAMVFSGIESAKKRRWVPVRSL